jgi:hypothetical protein
MKLPHSSLRWGKVSREIFEAPSFVPPNQTKNIKNIFIAAELKELFYKRPPSLEEAIVKIVEKQQERVRAGQSLILEMEEYQQILDRDKKTLLTFVKYPESEEKALELAEIVERHKKEQSTWLIVHWPIIDGVMMYEDVLDSLTQQ